MSVTATTEGRNLVLHVDFIDEPFIIAPLGGRAGQQLTNDFLNISAGITSPLAMDDVLARAVGAENFERIKEHLTLVEGENVLLPAFYWQTVLGLDGVNAFISGGEGLAGAKKALELLILTLGISPSQTSPSTALETLIPKLGRTTPTTTPPTGKTVDKLPLNKRSRKPKFLRPKPAA
jgi:hypothetical protein